MKNRTYIAMQIYARARYCKNSADNAAAMAEAICIACGDDPDGDIFANAPAPISFDGAGTM